MKTPVLLVAHGQPSHPLRAEVELAQLAARIAPLLPNHQVASATLAAPEALLEALARLGSGGLVYPLFMAGGWFTRSHLPKRLAEAGATGWTILEPMGCDPAIHQLAVRLATETPAKKVVLAAHGSGQSPVPAAIARHVARLIADAGTPAEVAFIDQGPRLADLPPQDAQTLCLPFFAANGDHVTKDIPAALAAAGFAGKILPALGLAPQLAAIIAAAILRGDAACPQTCRWAAAAPTA